MHPVLILVVKVLVDSIPGMTQDVSWTVVNLSYMAVGTFDIGRSLKGSFPFSCSTMSLVYRSSLREYAVSMTADWKESRPRALSMS